MGTGRPPGLRQPVGGSPEGHPGILGMKEIAFEASIADRAA